MYKFKAKVSEIVTNRLCLGNIYIIIYIIRYITIKSINDRNLRLILNKVVGYIKENNGNGYLISASTNKNKKTLKKYTELWDEVKNQIKFKK